MPLPHFPGNFTISKNRTRMKKIKKIFDVDKYSRQKEESKG